MGPKPSDTRFRVRLYDDRLELLLGAHLLMTLERGRGGAIDQRRLPDPNALLLRFAPDPARLPDVLVYLAPLSSYDVLVDSGAEVAA